MKKISELTDMDVIHCPTEDEANAILKLADEAGHPWCIKSNCWSNYKQNTCYCIIRGSYTELDWYVEQNYTIHKASEFLDVRKFKIGDKVVPIGKSKGTMSNFIERDLKKQGYLYITQINKDTLFYGHVDYVCDTTESGSGDFFMEEDLIPYVEEFVLPKKWCVFIKDGDSVPDKYKGGCYKTRYYAYSEPINGQLLNYIAGLGKMDAYKEITFEQFKKYVLKQDDMQLTELPQAWFVKNDKSQLFKDTVIKYLNCNYNKDYGGSALSYYGIDTYGRADYWSNVKYFGANAVELTLEQFIKLTTKNDMALKVGDKVVGKQSKLTATNGNEYDIFTETYVRTIEAIDDDTIILDGDGKTSFSDYEIKFYAKDFKLANSTKEMTKEIIGYKCPQDLYEGQIKCGDVLVYYSPKGYAKDELGEKYYVPKEIVEQWEPVYKEEFKVGDWVIVEKPCQSSGNKKGLVGKITELENGGLEGFGEGLLCEIGNYWEHPKGIRKATTQEVESHLIALAKEKGFVDGVTYKSFLGYTFNISNVRFRYSPIQDVLEIGDVNGGWFSSIYEKGKWATIIPTKKVVSVGGKFDVTIKDGKIWHNNDDITTFVEELVGYFTTRQRFGAYTATISNVEFSQTGCQNVTTTYEQWLAVWDEYNKLQK